MRRIRILCLLLALTLTLSGCAAAAAATAAQNRTSQSGPINRLGSETGEIFLHGYRFLSRIIKSVT